MPCSRSRTTSEQLKRLSPCLADEATTFCDATRQALVRQLSQIDERIGHLQEAREAVARQLETADLFSRRTSVGEVGYRGPWAGMCDEWVEECHG